VKRALPFCYLSFKQKGTEMSMNSNTELTPQPESEKVETNPSFREELAALLNSYSLENGSNTPDFILADYLIECLTAFNNTVNNRTRWHQF
jgi:hypothetical protein